MNLVKVIGAIATALYLGACASTGAPVSGMLYTDVQYEGAVNKPQLGAQKGEACATSILGMVATGDSSITAAKKAGRLADVSHVDHSGWSILGLYGKHCTIAYGTRAAAPATPAE